MSKIIDATLPLGAGMLTYPGDPVVSLKRISDMSSGAASNLSLLSMSTHTGTHVDPPIHFVTGGTTIDRVPLDTLIGKASVVDMRGNATIGPRELDDAGLPPDTTRVLFLTDWSARWDEASPAFPESYTAVSSDGARWLVERGVRLVGTDFISIEGSADPTYPVHRTLLGADIVIVEGLDLRDAHVGECAIWCLPLKIRDGDGGPARVVLIVD